MDTLLVWVRLFFFLFVITLIFFLDCTDSKPKKKKKKRPCENLAAAEWRQIKTVWGINLGLAQCLANKKRTAGRLEQIFYLSLFHFQTVSLHSKHQVLGRPHDTGHWNLWRGVLRSHTFSTFEPQSLCFGCDQLFLIPGPRPASTELGVIPVVAISDADKRKSVAQTTEPPITDGALVSVSIHGPEALIYTLKPKASRRVWPSKARPEPCVSVTAKEQRSRTNRLTFQITQKSNAAFFSANHGTAHRARLQNEQCASSVLFIRHDSEGEYLMQLTLESNTSVNNCWCWLVADTDASVQEPPLRTLDKLFKVWKKSKPSASPSSVSSSCWVQMTQVCRQELRPHLQRLSVHGARAETRRLLKYPARKTLNCAETSCLLDANRPWNSIWLIYTNFQVTPSRRGARDSLRMCVFVLLTASQGAWRQTRPAARRWPSTLIMSTSPLLTSSTLWVRTAVICATLSAMQTSVCQCKDCFTFRLPFIFTFMHHLLFPTYGQ